MCFYFFLKINQDRVEGFVIMILLVVLIIGIGIWHQIIEKPKQKIEFNKWFIEKKNIIDLKLEIKKILVQLGNQITPCKKCNSTNYQIWGLNNFLIIRCISCKRKEEHSVNNLNDINTIFDAYISLYDEYYITENSFIKDYLKNNLEWDFDSIRKGNSLYSVFEIFAIKEIEINIESNTSSNKSRRISQIVKDQVWNRDKGRCIECGSNERLEFDHIIPFSKGGSNTYRNIQLLCENCNRVKSDKIG